MKLITNSAEIKVTENEDGSKSLQGIGSEVGVKNLNDITLTPNCIDFDRERYPLLYEHGAGSSEVIGDAKVYYDLASNKYLTDFILYDNAPNITKAVENGAFNALSMAYYITDYEFAPDDSLIVNKAQFKEISLVSVPADPNARFIQNALGEELTEERNKIIESRNALKEIEDIKKKITSGIYTSGAYLQTIPYSSHFYVKEIYNKYLETLELNFFISKYTEQSDRDGEKVSIYCLNYGLCQKKNLPWGKPQGGKYRKYFIQRPFNMSVVLNEFLMQGQAIYCTKCGATFTQEQLPLLEFSHFKCNRCQGQVVKTSMLTESIKNELKKFQNEELLPQTETRVLLFLCNQNIALYAKDIAEELDMSSQSVAQICKRLDTDYGYIYRARQGTDKYMYSATEKARGFYV